MSALAALQGRFLAGILAESNAAATDVRGTPRFTTDQRLRVYANAYRRRLVEALAAVHERCAALLGEEAFETLALAYVDTHPPTERSLGRYGADFPAWLRARERTLAVAAGVATIDAGLRRAFDAADAVPAERAALQSLAPSDWAVLRFAWVPALAMGAVDARAIETWREPTPKHSDDAERVSVAVAFWRREGQTFFRSLSADEARLFERLRAGACLATACMAEPSIPFDLAASALRLWVDEGWVAAVHAPETL